MTEAESLVLIGPDKVGAGALVCIPPAGGGSAFFRSWGPALAGSAAVWAARLPGRENRTLEPPLTSIGEMADALVEHVLTLSADTVVLFGHCSGAWVAYELAHRLRAAGIEGKDLRLVVSAQHMAPSQPRSHELPVGSMSSAEFVEYLRERGGTSKEILASKELMELLLPAIRADVMAAQLYHDQRNRGTLDIPVIVLGGRADQLVSHEELQSWETSTTGPFCVEFFHGGHFFLQEREQQVLRFMQGLFPRRAAVA